MFYGSDEPETAIAEIDDEPLKGVSVGRFRIERDAVILDLTALPRRFGFSSHRPIQILATDMRWSSFIVSWRTWRRR